MADQPLPAHGNILSSASRRGGNRIPASGLRAPWPALALLLLAGFILSAIPAEAGTIHPALREELSRLAPNEQASAILILGQQARIPVLNEALKLEQASRAERHRRVVEELQRTARETQGGILAELSALKAAGQISGYTPYWIANLIVIRGTRSTLEQLSTRLDVDVLEPNFRPALMQPVDGKPAPEQGEGTRGIGVTPGLRAIRAPEVWYQLGINGAEVLVANLDTGVDGAHPALQSRWRGNNGHPWQECWLDVLGTGTQYPNDGYGHGTHVMGTITGLGAATQDTIGVAWGAQWIAANAINQGVGGDFDNDIIQCFQWFADPDGNPNTVDDVPDVVQNSWRINEGFGGGYTDCDTRWWAVIDNCEAASVCVTWSAGNEGPSPQTIGSPPDRATTPYNVFSVGAVDATNASWPYPIAGWSSRGPTGCNVAAPLKIKPEISAPGVDVYSSVPGGSYQQSGWSGTSMAGPHVAGVCALMRGANPNIDVETMKQIIMDTARDEGAAGEDNNYGWGFIDAYEAVLRCMTGYGTLAGDVTNASNGGTAIPGARVRLVELNRIYTADNVGHYSGMASPGTYTVEATHPSFATVTQPGVVLVADQTTTQNFSLVDILGPTIDGVNYSQSTPSPNDPFPVTASITDFSAVSGVQLTWRVDGGGWTAVPMVLQGGSIYQGLIPNQPVGSHIEFYLEADDVAGNITLSPADAPATLYDIYVVQGFFTDDFETDKGWSTFLPSDTQTGRWARWDPYGTIYNGVPCEPADDHTPPPGTLCYNTGVGQPGGPAESSDVDNGCVTLTSPTIDLSGAQAAFVSYWRWFALEGPHSGFFVAQASGNNGLTWISLEFLGATANAWTYANFNLAGVVGFTNQVKFRFVACDTADDSIVEAAVDDFSVQGIPSPSSSVPSPVAATTAILYDNRPNPFSRETSIGFRLGRDRQVTLAIYDPAGRLVRSLVSGNQTAGEHSVQWDGRDDTGKPVGAGLYFYELRTDDSKTQRKMLMLK